MYFKTSLKEHSQNHPVLLAACQTPSHFNALTLCFMCVSYCHFTKPFKSYKDRKMYFSHPEPQSLSCSMLPQPCCSSALLRVSLHCSPCPASTSCSSVTAQSFDPSTPPSQDFCSFLLFQIGAPQSPSGAPGLTPWLCEAKPLLHPSHLSCHRVSGAGCY